MKTPPLQPEAGPDQPAPLPACLNCGTELTDQYCRVCGQRKQRRVVSVITVFGEFFSELANWDSRLWRTLWPLFFRPGLLTRSYMDGKRARYIPPVRLYLISSVVFFVVVSFSPKAFFNDISNAVDQNMGGLDQPITSQIDRTMLESILKDAGVSDVAIESDDEQPVDPDIPETQLDEREVLGVDDPPAEQTADLTATADLTDKEDSPVQVPESLPEDSSTLPNGEADTGDESGEAPAAGDESTGDGTVQTVLEYCEEIKTADLGSWELLRSYFYNTCLSFSTWRGMLQFAQELIDNLPKTLLVLLPLMALFNKFLYLFPMRYYVEHLLFYVHNFSFLFLFSLTLVTISALAGLAGLDLSGILTLVGMVYTIYYFLRSMRVVYGQGRVLTFLKWLMQLLAFFTLTPFVLTFFALATAALHAL